ncbi:MAG: hypothetical protein KF764_09155 [Labilithrix sp.]|nr:hypothetical protein [Labilithrix sp.]
MCSNNTLLAFVLAAVSFTACRRSPDAERSEAAEAELRAAKEPAEIESLVIDEKHDYVAVVRREQLELRARVRASIAEIDRQLDELRVHGRATESRSDPRSTLDAEVEALRERRRVLAQDAVDIERADERGWAELKARIEGDLAGGRPRGRS